jgi:hypothetical protein
LLKNIKIRIPDAFRPEEFGHPPRQIGNPSRQIKNGGPNKFAIEERY